MRVDVEDARRIHARGETVANARRGANASEMCCTIFSDGDRYVIEGIDKVGAERESLHRGECGISFCRCS